MSNCPRPVQVCDPQLLKNRHRQPCPDWDVCLPWGGRLYQRDGCVRYEPGKPPEDGVYGQFTIQDGCFVSAEEYPVPKYQSDPCAPVPCPCDSTGGDGGNLCNPSTVAGNLYSCDAAGKPLVKAYVNGGDNVSVTGNGTSTNPFVISIDQGDAGVLSLSSGSSCLTVTPNSGAVEITHREGFNDQTIMGMVFDQYGHLTSYSPQASDGITGITAGYGITVNVDQNSKIATVALQEPAYKLAGEYQLGGYRMELDQYNRVYNITRDITTTAQTYPFGAYDVTLNEYGSIEELALADFGACIQGFFTVSSAEATRRNLTFTLRTPSRLIVEVEANAETADWGEELAFFMDEDPMSNKLVFVTAGPVSGGDDTGTGGGGSGEGEPATPSAYPTRIKLLPSGVYAAGQHVLTLQHSAGFPLTEAISVCVTPMVNFDSTETLNTGDY